MEPLLWRGFIIHISHSSGTTVSRLEISVKRSIREVISHLKHVESIKPTNIKAKKIVFTTKTIITIIHVECFVYNKCIVVQS
jgi:hypothetical protein